MSSNAGSRRYPSRSTAGVLAAASEPDVPFGAVARVATIVVLARRSASDRVGPAALTTSATERGSVCPSGGAGGLPRLLLLLRP